MAYSWCKQSLMHACLLFQSFHEPPYNSSNHSILKLLSHLQRTVISIHPRLLAVYTQLGQPSAKIKNFSLWLILGTESSSLTMIFSIETGGHYCKQLFFNFCLLQSSVFILAPKIHFLFSNFSIHFFRRSNEFSEDPAPVFAHLSVLSTSTTLSSNFYILYSTSLLPPEEELVTKNLT